MSARLSTFTIYQPTPAVKLHLVFANDEAYGNVQSDHPIRRSLNQISMMSHTQWSALQTLHLEELPNSRSATLTKPLTYGMFISSLLQSLNKAKPHWKYLPHPNFGLRLATIRIDGYDPEPALLVPGQQSFNTTLRVGPFGIQSVLEFILECLSAPLDCLHLTNVTMPVSLLQTLASISKSLHMENVFSKTDEGGRTAGYVSARLATNLESLWVDASGLSAYFSLRLPLARIRILHLRISDRLREVFQNGMQNLLDLHASSLEELRYEPYWVGCNPAEHVARTSGVAGDIDSCLDFSQLTRLRVVELMLSSMDSPDRYSRVAVWMSPDGGKLAQRIRDNSPPRIGVNNAPHGHGSSETPRPVRSFLYGIRLIGFQAVEREGYYKPYLDILPDQMKVDVKIDRLRPARVRHGELVMRSPGGDDSASVREPVMSRW